MRLIIIAVFATVAILTGTIVFRLAQPSPPLPQTTKNTLEESTDGISAEVEVEKTSHNPPPLVRDSAGVSAPKSHLTAAATLSQTNQHRSQNNLPTLKTNQQLTIAAQSKIDDMIANQYFAHDSPSGVTPSQLVESAGYQYLATAENLARGPFADDADLVISWMNSPGHRENILNSRFTEIGIAVQLGFFEGHQVWFAVQEFGKPASACTEASPSLRGDIETNQAQLVRNLEEIEIRQNEINNLRDEATSLENTVTSLSNSYQAKISAGNAKVEAGNQAAAAGNQAQAESLWSEGHTLQDEAKQIFTQLKTQNTAYQNTAADFNNQNDQLNQKIDTYNSLRNQVQADVATLNQQINTYNACVTN